MQSLSSKGNGEREDENARFYIHSKAAAVLDVEADMYVYAFQFYLNASELALVLEMIE